MFLFSILKDRFKDIGVVEAKTNIKSQVEFNIHASSGRVLSNSYWQLLT